MPLIESIVLSIGAKAGSSASLSLLREIAGLQNEQVAVLKEMREDIRKMVDGPWRKAMVLVEQAVFTTGASERRARLHEARDALFTAYSQEPEATPRRATIAVDLAVVHWLLDELDHARRWATKAHEDQSAAVTAAVDVALKALNSRASALKSAIDGDFWSLVDTSRKKDPAGTERWIREKYEGGEPPAELPPANFLADAGGSVDAQEGIPQAIRALSGRWGAEAAREHYRRWAWENSQRSIEGSDHDVRPFLSHVAIAETTSAGGRELMRLHRMVRDLQAYRQIRLALEPGADVPDFELGVDLSHPRHARIAWHPAPPPHRDRVLQWRGSQDVVDVAFSPDGARLVVACGSAAHVLDSGDGRELARLRHPRNTLGVVWAVAYSPDGRTIATGSGDHTARLWAGDSGREQRSMRHLTVLGFVRDVAFSADGRRLATAAGDNTVRLWDCASGRQLLKMSHDKPAWSVAVSPDGQLIASAGEDHTVRLWSSLDGREVLRVGQPNPTEVVFSPTGRLVAASGGDHTRIWDSRDGREVSNSLAPGWSVAFSPDGRSLAIGGRDAARVVDAFSGSELSSYPHGGLVKAVAFSLDGRRLATAGDDGVVRVWRLR